MYLGQFVSTRGMGWDTCLLSGTLGASHLTMSTSQACVLDTSIEKPFRGVFCHMVRLMLELGGFANWNWPLVEVILELDMCNQICRFLQIFSIGSMLFFKILEFASVYGPLTSSKSIQEFHVFLKQPHRIHLSQPLPCRIQV